MAAPLAVRPFGRLLAGYTVNTAGDRIGVVALALLVYDQTRDPLATTALFLAAEFVPALVAPALTARLDRQSPRRSLPALYALEAVAFGALALTAASAFWLPLVLALAFVDGVLALTARGLLRAAVGAVLAPAGVLRQGNALLNVGFSLASVAGAAAGGALVALIGVPAALLVNAASFVVIAALLAGAAGLARPGVPEAAPARGRVREALVWVRRNRVPRALFAGEALALVCFTAIVPVEVVYAAETLDTDAAGYGALLAAWGVGILVGSAAYVRLTSRPSGVLILGSTLAIGVAYAGMGATTELAVACALSVLGGAGNGMQWVSVMTRLQEETPEALQARVTGLLESLGSGMTGLGFVAGGVVTAALTPATAFTAAGACLIGLVAVAALVLRPRRRPAAP